MPYSTPGLPLKRDRGKKSFKCTTNTNHHQPEKLKTPHLLQRNEPRRVGSTNTGTTVLDRLVRDGEFTEVVADHLGLDFDLVEDFTGVDTHDGTDHFGDDDHVAEVGLDEVGLLVGLGFLLGFAELLDQAHGLALETAVEASAGAGVNDVAELFGGEVEETVL